MKSTVSHSVITLFKARRIYTMEPSLPQAEAVAVADGRILAVGSMDSMAPWCEGRNVTVDDSFQNHVLLPGLIDNHIHPFLGAMLMPTEHIAPEPWRQADGSIRPAARTPEEYRRLLLQSAAAQPDPSQWFVSFGYQPKLHGRYTRTELDALFPDRPVILIQRSFHESYCNSAAIHRLKITAEQVAGHPQADWDNGHFYETGNKLVLGALMPDVLKPEWYGSGLAMTTRLMHQGGITTAGDMLFGSLNPEYELSALDEVLHRGDAPMRVVNIFDARGFSNRASGKTLGPPTQSIDFDAGLAAMQPLFQRAGPKVWFSQAAKLFADGAMFSQLMQMNPPGYLDGHHGEWLMSPEVLAAGVRTFWNAGWQIHVHVNGDAGMDAVLSALEEAQAERPRNDHRFFMHHVGYSAASQTSRIAALGAHASVNPYYIHALADDYARFGLGEERASHIVRAGSMSASGMRVSFHSDFMMAPPEPLLLAWCAATRRTREGRVVAPDECLSLMQALRGITIDAAWALRVEHEVGSIATGKRADFCVLADDPFELGPDRLKDVRIAGTVFEGQSHMLSAPQASLLSALPSPLSHRRQGLHYRPLTRCNTALPDLCEAGRQIVTLAARHLHQTGAQL